MRFSSFASILALAFVPIATVAQSLPPSVASLTHSQTVEEGRPLTLSVSADGTTPFTFQWKKDGAAISGAASTSYVIDPVRVTHEGSYTVTITNSVGSITSDPILIAVTPATLPSFYYQPSSASFTVGQSLSLYAYASGSEPMTFEWRKDGAIIAGATSRTYSKASAAAGDAGIYTVKATNIAGSATSNEITLTAASATAPAITSQPPNIAADPGSTPYVYFSASGTQPLTYELLKGDTVVTSNTWGSLYLPTLTDAEAGTYRVRVTNAIGSATSNPFTVTVNPPRMPKVSVNSSTVRLTIGQSLYLSVYVSDGTAPLTYQWYKEGVAIGGATSYGYSKSNVQSTDTGNYTIKVSNAAGSVTSDPINVAVSALRAPLITSHPASGTYREGEWVSLWVSALGDQLAYQWYKDGAALPGATSSNYYIGNSFSAAHAGTYTVKVSNSIGATTSEPAVLSVLPAYSPIISADPVSRSVHSGEGVGFGIQYEANPAPTFQWKKDGVAIAGATSSGFWIDSPAASDAGTYTVTVTNSAGSVTSSGAVLTVRAPTVPVIVRHPASASLLPGGYHTLGVGLQHTYGVSYQWKRDGTAIAGATSSSYSIHSAQPSHAGIYTVTITSPAGSVTSEGAEIRVDTNSTRPVISFSTGSAAVASGNSVDFSIGTSVTPTAIQWHLDGVPIPNQKSANLYFTASAAAVGSYTAVVTTSGGTFTSRVMKLTLLNSAVAPTITYQPRSQSIEPGAWVAFEVGAAGESPLSYQWRKNGTNIPLANSAYFSFHATSSDAGTYSVVVTNAHGSVTSADATLTVRAATAPTITTHPVSQAVSSSSSSLSLSVSATGTSPLTYQWRKDAVNIAGATSYYLHRSVDANAAGRYSVVVTNSAGSATSLEAVVTIVDVATGPVFTTQPAAASAYAGASVTLTGAATGRGTIAYQWRKNGTAISGATGASLTLSNLTAGDGAVYTLVASDADGSTSSQSATLTVLPSLAPSITTHPQSAYVLAGANVTFSAAATGTPAPSLQWYRNSQALGGATSATLTLNNAQAGDAGAYALVATNAAGSATSHAATLTLLSQPAAAPSITSEPSNVTAAIGGTATFSVTATGSPTPSYQWRKNGANIGGATGSSLTLTNIQEADAGSYSVIATNAFGSAVSREATLTVGAKPTAIYFGNIGGGGNTGTWALLVMNDNTGQLLAILPSRNQVIVTTVTLAADGSFSFGEPASAQADGMASTAARYYTGPGEGKIGTGGVFTGKLSALNLTLTPTFSAIGLGSGYAGYYIATPLYSAAGAAHAISAADGQCFVIVTDADGVFGGIGTLSNGQFEVLPSSGAAPKVSGTFDPATSTLTGKVQFSGRPEVTLAPATLPSGNERLINLSTRAQAGRDANTLIAGFVVSGNQPKKMLIRAAGPALEKHNVTGFLADPRLMLYRGKTAVLENDDWGVGASAGAIAAAASSVGAFEFPSGSKDAALLVDLAPDLYSAHVTGGSTATGVSLVEIYEVGGGNGAPRLINLSSRSHVGTGDNILIVGLVVTGDSPKRYLIRGVGPTLRNYDVTGVLENPHLRLHKGQTVVRDNDDWSAGGDAGDIASASARVGAFPLPVGSKDAALLVYLEPGLYSAHVTGVNNTTGVALIEAYEVP